MHRGVHPRLTALVTATALLLAGCTLPFGSSSGSNAGSSTGSAGTPDQVLKDAITAMKALTSYHVKVDTGGLFNLDVDARKGTGVKGKVTIFGSTVDYIAIGGNEYASGEDYKSLLTQAGQPADAWVQLDASNQLFTSSGFGSDYDFVKIADCVSQLHGTLTNGQVSTVSNIEVQEIKDAGDKPGSVEASYYVARSGTKYLVRLQQKGTQKPGGTMPPGCAALLGGGAGPSPGGSASPTIASSGPTASSGDNSQTAVLDFSAFGQNVDISAPVKVVPQSKLPGSTPLGTTQVAGRTAADRVLIGDVRNGLAALADPARAAAQQAYMKSSMPYYGVTARETRRTVKVVFATHPLPSFAAWRDTALELWRNAGFREERYAALELAGYLAYREHQVLAALPMYEEMVVTGAWWDYVDDVAVHRLGPLLLSFPGPMKETMRAWSVDPDMWRRRSSIICQVSAKGNTDVDLLEACIESNLDGRDFFIRKAIGWSLRAYAHVDPQWVAGYVRGNQDRLSGLSRREALKHIGP